MESFFKLDKTNQVKELFKLVTNTGITIQKQSLAISSLEKKVEELQAQLDNKLVKVEKVATQEVQQPKKPQIGDYKTYYFKGRKIFEETPKEIIIECEKGEKTKTLQTHIGQYSKTYDIPLNLSGEKPEGKKQVEWCKNIDYKGEIIPFKGHKQILKKQA